MKKLTLDLEALGVETFATSPRVERMDQEYAMAVISRRSCIEQCTTSCTVMV
jgi:hypothetical protein